MNMRVIDREATCYIVPADYKSARDYNTNTYYDDDNNNNSNERIGRIIPFTHNVYFCNIRLQTDLCQKFCFSVDAAAASVAVIVTRASIAVFVLFCFVIVLFFCRNEKIR